MPSLFFRSILPAVVFFTAITGCDLDSEEPSPVNGATGPVAVLLEIDGEIPSFPNPADFLKSTAMSQYRLEDLLNRASNDVQVQEVIVHFLAPQIGWARAGEIGDAISRFKESGKPITCHLEEADNLTYWMASRSCSKIAIAPAGGIDLIGLSLEAIFLKDLLDSMGVTADILHEGKYKDAADALTRNDMSPESREAMESLLDELHKNLVAGIASGRKLDNKTVNDLIDGGPYTASKSVKVGLADEVATIGALLEAMREKYPGGVQDEYGKEPHKPPSFTDLISLLGGSTDSADPKPTHPRIAVIPAIGPIVGGSGKDDLLGSIEVISDMDLVTSLSEATRDDSIKAVVLRIDSPGGSALASDNIWEAVRSLSRKKPVVASMGDVAASGGYYIASAATEIYASGSTLTGSIGVVGGKVVLAGATEKLGVHTQTLSRGKRAAMASPFHPFNEEERSAVAGLMKSTYDIFIDRVVTGRKLDRAAVLASAQGRVWTGSQALSMGLIDKMGTFHDAVERAQKLAGTPGAPVEIHPKPKSFMEILTEQITDQQNVFFSGAYRFPGGRSALVMAYLLRGQRVLTFSPVFFEVR